MTLELIPATEQDRIFYRQVHHIAYRDDIEKMFGWDEVRQDAYADKDFDTRNPTLISFNGHHAGVIGWQDKHDHIWFGPIFILPEYQGHNVGTLILQQFIDRANKEKLPLRLQTLLINEKAKSWYQKLGFSVIEQSAIHWQMEYQPR